MDLLTENIMQYQKNGIDRNGLFEKLHTYIYFFPGRNFRDWDEEDSAEYLLSFIPRLTVIISRFKYEKKSFEVYLNRYLFWHMKTLRREKKKRKLMDNFLFDQISGMQKSLDSERKETDDIPEIPERLNKIKKKRLLIYFLLNANKWDDTALERFSELLSCSADSLFGMSEEIKTLTDKKRLKSRKLKEYSNYLLMNRHFLEEKINQCAPDSVPGDLRKKLSINRKKIDKTYKKINALNTKASHIEVAEILNIPKGTVDSGIYYLKRNLAEIEYNNGDLIS